jgi:hypothetical protein
LQVPLSKEELEALKAAPEKMAIGGEGGFNVGAPKYKFNKERALVVFPSRIRVPLPCHYLPELVIQVIDAVVVSITPISPALNVLYLHEEGISVACAYILITCAYILITCAYILIACAYILITCAYILIAYVHIVPFPIIMSVLCLSHRVMSQQALKRMFLCGRRNDV